MDTHYWIIISEVHYVALKPCIVLDKKIKWIVEGLEVTGKNKTASLRGWVRIEFCRKHNWDGKYEVVNGVKSNTWGEQSLD
jgi:hypothetical protein